MDDVRLRVGMAVAKVMADCTGEVIFEEIRLDEESRSIMIKIGEAAIAAQTMPDHDIDVDEGLLRDGIPYVTDSDLHLILDMYRDASDIIWRGLIDGGSIIAGLVFVETLELPASGHVPARTYHEGKTYFASGAVIFDGWRPIEPVAEPQAIPVMESEITSETGAKSTEGDLRDREFVGVED